MSLTLTQMFSGIDGFRLGLEHSGWKCLWSNDNDKYACQISKKNYGDGVLDERDIREVDAREIPDHTLLTAGFPCQAFSIAGKRKATKEGCGTLFTHIARVARTKRPKLLLLENVKGILSSDSGRTFAIILRTLGSVGYLLEWQVLNSKHFGVPQNRQRVFIVGHLRGASTKQIFPIREAEGTTIEVEAQEQDNIAGTLTANYGSKFNDTYIKCAPTLIARCDDRGFFTRQLAKQTGLIRRLTPIECERLQGFPDRWTESISDTQRYKLLGNAVTVNVIKFLGERLRECLN